MILHRDNDRGDSPIMLVVAITAMMLAVGFVVDGGGKLQANDRAQYAAEQAARAAGQEIQAGQVHGGNVPGAAGRGHAAAQSVLAAHDVTGSVSFSGSEVTVRTTTTYSTKFLAVIGVSTLTSRGESTAQITRGITQGGQ